MNDEYFKLDDGDFAQLSLTDRFSLAKALSKSYWQALAFPMLAIGLIVLTTGACCLSLMNLSPEILAGLRPYEPGGNPAAILFGSIMLLALIFFIIPFLGLGVKNLALCYIYGTEPKSVLAAMMEPGSRLGFFSVCFLLWFGVNLVYQVVSVILGSLPVLGLLMVLVVAVFINMAGNCSTAYMADQVLHKRNLISPIKTVVEPIRLVWLEKSAWVLSYLLVFCLLFIPSFIIGLGVGFINGGVLSAWILIGLGVVLIMPIMVFNIFLMAITYKCSQAKHLSAYS